MPTNSFQLKKLFVFFLLISPSLLLSQDQPEPGKMKMEIVSSKIGVNAGPYRGRVENGENGIGLQGQIFLPFQFSIDKTKNFDKETPCENEYCGRLFLIRPVTVLHVTDQGSFTAGISPQLSFHLFNDFYFDAQIGVGWVEPQGESDGMRRGLNFMHFYSINKPISANKVINLGFVHISNGNLFSGDGSNHDMLVAGMRFHLHKQDN